LDDIDPIDARGVPIEWKTPERSSIRRSPARTANRFTNSTRLEQIDAFRAQISVTFGGKNYVKTFPK
jgi:hypothetical protein